MMDTTSYGVRSAEARSIFCDQSAGYVRIIARLASAKFTLLPGAAPQVGQRTASTCFGLSSFFIANLHVPKVN